MADITFDSASNSGYQTQDGSGNYSWFHPQHDGDYVKISLSLFYPEVVESNPDGASVTFGGVELELLPEEAGANLLGAQLWGGNVPPSEDVVEVLVTLEGLNIDSIAFATVLLGVHQTSPVIMADIATGSTNPAEVVLDVGTDPGYWVVDAVATSDASITVGSGQTQRGNVSGAAGSGGQSTETGNDPTGMSWTGVTSAWVMCAVALRPAATQSYTLAAGSGAFNLTGQSAALLATRKIVANNGSFQINREPYVDAALRVARKFSASSGVFVLTGQATAFHVGHKVAAGSVAFTFTGQSAGLKRGRKSNPGTLSYSFTGQAASLRVVRRLTMGSGSFSFTGTSATLRLGRKIGAGSGAFIVTGQTAGLKFGHNVAAGSGAFVVTGQAAAFHVSPKFAAASGAFSFTGQAATFRSTRRLSAESGTFVFTGYAASKNIIASSGAFTLTGAAATLRSGKSIMATSGAFNFTGQTAGLKAARKIAASPGAFLFTGQDASFGLPMILNAVGGTFQLVGYSVYLNYSHNIKGDKESEPVNDCCCGDNNDDCCFDVCPLPLNLPVNVVFPSVTIDPTGETPLVILFVPVPCITILHVDGCLTFDGGDTITGTFCDGPCTGPSFDTSTYLSVPFEGGTITFQVRLVARVAIDPSNPNGHVCAIEFAIYYVVSGGTYDGLSGGGIPAFFLVPPCDFNNLPIGYFDILDVNPAHPTLQVGTFAGAC